MTNELRGRINAAWDDVYEAIQERTITREFGDRILGRIAAIRSAADASTHGPEGNEGYCRCGYFVGRHDPSGAAAHAFPTSPSPDTQEARP